MDVIETNSTLRKISAVQKRHLESLAEGPVYFGPGELLWRTGTPVEKAYILVGGTVSFRAKRRNASVGVSVVSLLSFIESITLWHNRANKMFYRKRMEIASS